jgi:DNA-binding transcriptional LysR family regulator
MRYFVAVAEERHFGHAADRLGIAQPGLSQQIKALERSLGVLLLIRDSRGVRLTAAGEVFLEHARLAIEQAERAAATTRLAAVQGKKGLLKIGTRASGMPPRGSELLERFRDRHPEVQIDAFPGFAPQGVEGVTSHLLDAAILLSPFDGPPDLRYLRLGTVEIIAALPEGHPLAAMERIPRSDLLQETVIDYPSTVNTRLVRHIRDLLFEGREPPKRLEVAEFVEVGRLLRVKEGRGVATTLSFLAEQLPVPGVVFRPFCDPVPYIEYGVVWLDGGVSPSLPLFLEMAREVAEPILPSSVQAAEPAPAT